MLAKSATRIAILGVSNLNSSVRLSLSFQFMILSTLGGATYTAV
jgi:hypothetical protein